MSSEFNLKRLMIEIGRRAWSRGYVAANDGNFTFRLDENLLLTTPSGVSKGFMTPEMILKADMDGKPVSANSQYRPSSEIKMHIEVYRQRPDVKSVIHVHPPYCTSFAVAGIPLDKCVLPEAIVDLGAVPIAEYGLPSTQEIPEAIREHIKKSDAILLANHGALTLGRDLLDAYNRMERLEHSAHIIWNAIQLGQVNVLPAREAERIQSLRNTYNITGRAEACSTDQVLINGNNSDTNSGYSIDKMEPELIHKIAVQIIEKIKKDRSVNK